MFLPFALLLAFLFVAPALVAYLRARRVDARRGSLLATVARIATARAVLVVGVVIVEAIIAFLRFFETFAVAVGDAPAFDENLTPTARAALIVPSLAVIASLVLFVLGLRTAVRIRRASRRVRNDADRADPPAQARPAIDFGVGDAFWVFRHEHAAGYRETAGSLEWARGTPPPDWAPFVVPVLDALYGLSFGLLCAASFATIVR